MHAVPASAACMLLNRLATGAGRGLWPWGPDPDTGAAKGVGHQAASGGTPSQLAHVCRPYQLPCSYAPLCPATLPTAMSAADASLPLAGSVLTSSVPAVPRRRSELCGALVPAMFAACQLLSRRRAQTARRWALSACALGPWSSELASRTGWAQTTLLSCRQPAPCGEAAFAFTSGPLSSQPRPLHMQACGWA